LVREATVFDTLAKDTHKFHDHLKLPGEVAKQIAPPTTDGNPLTSFADERARVFHSLVVADHALPEVGPSGEERPRFLFMKERLFHALAVVSGVAVALAPADRVLVPGRTTDFAIGISNAGGQTVSPYLL